MRMVSVAELLLLVGLIFAHPLSAQDSDTLPLPRDPDVAVQEEFAMARESNTRQAWQLFILRHGDHPLAREAARQLDQLKK